MCPIVSRAATVLRDKDVFWVIQVGIRRGEDVVDDLATRVNVRKRGTTRFTYARLKVDQDGTRDVVLVVCLVEEDVLAVAALCRPVFEYALLVDAVFSTQPLPVDRTHFERNRESALGWVPGIDRNRTLVAALPQLHRHNFARHCARDSDAASAQIK